MDGKDERALATAARQPGESELKGARGKLAARFQRMRDEEGLVDMKFFFGQVSEATVDDFCEEVNRLHKFVEEGKFTEIKHWGDSKGLPDRV